MSDIANRLRARRKSLKVSQEELARRCGWSDGQTRISSYENGRTVPNYSDIALLARALDTSAAYLAFGSAEERDSGLAPAQSAGVPNLEYGKSVTPLPGTDSNSTIRLDDELAPKADLAKCRWFRITDTSMQPLMPPGTAILIDTSDTRIQSGKAYAVDIGGLVWVRWVYQLPRAEVRLAPENTAEWEDHTVFANELDDFTVLGRVVWSSTTW